jgi:hypothetical protein
VNGGQRGVPNVWNSAAVNNRKNQPQSLQRYEDRRHRLKRDLMVEWWSKRISALEKKDIQISNRG